MMDENKGYIMTIIGIIATAFLVYKIDYQINDETVRCVISIVFALFFSSLYVLEVIGNIAKFVTGFIVSYVMGMPLYRIFAKWFFPENYQTLVVMISLVLAALLFGVFLWTYTENTFLEAHVEIKTGNLFDTFFKPVRLMNTKSRCELKAKNCREDIKVKFSESKKQESDAMKAENEELKKINSTLKLENSRLKMRIELLELENKARICSFFDDNGIEVMFKDTDSDIRKKRFRKLSQIFHPDSEVGDAEIFRMIKEAYESVENS